MTARLLALDAGNSRLKWAVLDTDRVRQSAGDAATPFPWLAVGAVTYDELPQLPVLVQQAGPVTACFGVNVAGDRATAAIRQALAATGVAPVWLNATVAAGDLKNGYLPPESLGADRWAALRAARERTAEAALVVSAGSALTVDALSAAGQFLGGIILPGMQMMRHALAHATARVGMQHGEVRTWPNTTADAVETGLIAACTGAIKTLYGRLEKTAAPTPRIFVTGGDAVRLAAFLSLNARIIPGLVLEGVYYLSQEKPPT